jgi:hypothetical protein
LRARVPELRDGIAADVDLVPAQLDDAAKSLFDSVLYGLATGGAFAYLWPK